MSVYRTIGPLVMNFILTLQFSATKVNTCLGFVNGEWWNDLRRYRNDKLKKVCLHHSIF